MLLGNLLSTNALEREGIGWLRFSGDTYPQDEPQDFKDFGTMRSPQPLGSWEPFYRKPILAAPSEGYAGSQLTVWGGEKFPRESVMWLWGGLFPRGQCRASWQTPPPCPAYAHTHKPWPRGCWLSLQLHLSQGFSASALLAPGSDHSLSGELSKLRKVRRLIKVRWLLSHRVDQVFTQQTFYTTYRVVSFITGTAGQQIFIEHL